MRLTPPASLLCLVVAGCGNGTEPPPEAADWVLTGARIWTGNPSAPWAEALAVRGDRVLAVGSRDEIAPWVGETTRAVEAPGPLVVPGFVDSHVHFLDGGFRLSSVQLRDAASPEEWTRRIAEFAATVPAGTWILGGDWDHENWGGRLPTRAWIDEVTPEHPVWVNRLDGHMALANSLALELAGIDADTEEVDGGEIERDENGDPTGVLKDNAMPLVDAVVTPPSPEQEDRALDAAMRYVASRGVTSVHHMGTWHDLEVFRRNHAARRLRTRIYSAVPLATWERLAAEVEAQGRGDEWLRIGALKGFVDGSLGSHTAAFLEPYSDVDPSSGERGLYVIEEDELWEQLSGGDAAGLHLVVHAIGDEANRVLLDQYERLVRERGSHDRRYRIEHAQHLDPAELPRFAELGVIASMQPYHAIDDGRWAERVIGAERAHGTYAFRSLLDHDARLAFGSDWFVAPPDVMAGLYAAVTRRTLDDANPGGWVPEQKIAVEEALRAYTLDAAHASHEEGIKGSLEAGKLADLVVLDRDLFTVAPEELRSVEVALTVVGGEVVYTRD